MARLVSPDRGCVEADVRGRRYTGRIVDVDDPRAAADLKAAGYFEASMGGVSRTRGHECPTCHRFNYLPTCGRCSR